MLRYVAPARCAKVANVCLKEGEFKVPGTFFVQGGACYHGVSSPVSSSIRSFIVIRPDGFHGQP